MKNVNKYLIQTNLLNFIQIQRKQQKEKYRMFQGKLNQSFDRMNTNSCTQLDHPLAGKFYGTAKIHKLSQGDQVEKLPIRPIFFIIDTAIYRLAIHLAKLLPPSSTSEYTVNSTKDFIEKLRTIKAPKGYQMVSFDVKALFTNEPLEYTIDLVLKRIYENHEISA